MTILKISLPSRINEAFRRIVSRRRGVQKGVLKNATLTAISRYIGSDPEVALVASKHFVSVETPVQLAPKVLRVILPKKKVLFSVPRSLKEVEGKLGSVETTYTDDDYAVFRWKPSRYEALCSMGGFRAEWDDKELVFEEGCLSLTTRDLEESLTLAEKVAKALGLWMPQTPVPRQLEIYKWRDAEGQEVIIK
ncbi:MAG: hypothetical protein ACTSUQ_08535 [Candidatus Freyarchaeota archaeon]